jgi:heptosyltransferase-2
VFALRGDRRAQLRVLREARDAACGLDRSTAGAPGPASRGASRPGARSPSGARPAGLLFTNSFSTALLFRLAGIAATGFATDLRRLLLAKAVPVPAAWAGDLHMVGYYRALADTCVPKSVAARPVPATIDLKLSDRAMQQARTMLATAGVRAPWALLCPVAVGRHKGQVKAWPGFGALADALAEDGLQVVACPGPGEQAAVRAALPRAVLLPATDVATFGALLAASDLVVANDSGPGHLAAAVGARLVSVFGATDPRKTRPWGERLHRVGGAAGWPTLDAVRATVHAALADPRRTAP